MDWMYNKKNEIDRDAYLLGRSIDVAFVEMEEESKIKSHGKRRDIIKINEDPLNMIETKKLEFKQELLKNPLKMRKLRDKMNINDRYEKNNEEDIAPLDIKILKKWKRLRKLCFYFQNIPLEEFALTLFKNTKQPALLDHKKDIVIRSISPIKPESNVKDTHKEDNPYHYQNKEWDKKDKKKLRSSNNSHKSRDDHLEEMRRNVEWNRDHRKKVLGHRGRVDKEDFEKTSEDFIRPMLSDVVAQSNSLKSRINKNKYYIQRDTSDFKTDFVKR